MTARELYALTILTYQPDFDLIRLAKLKRASEKVIEDNDELTDNEYLIAMKVYLNFIRDFPQLDLG